METIIKAYLVGSGIAIHLIMVVVVVHAVLEWLFRGRERKPP